jgi:hypothetical protein
MRVCLADKELKLEAKPMVDDRAPSICRKLIHLYNSLSVIIDLKFEASIIACPCIVRVILASKDRRYFVMPTIIFRSVIEHHRGIEM